MTSTSTYRTLTITAMATSALLIAACNSSSSGGGGGDGDGSNQFDSLSQEQKEKLVANMAMDMDEFVTDIEGMGDMAFGMTGADSNFEDPRESTAFSAQGQDGPVTTQSFGNLCETGSHTVLANTSDHFHVEFNNCGGGFQGQDVSNSYTINGVVETEVSGSSTHTNHIMSRADNYTVESSTSGQGMNFSVGFEMDGQSNQDYTAWNNFILSADQTVKFDMSCDGNHMRAEFGFDNLNVTTQPSSMNPSDAEMDLSGAFSMSSNQGGMGGSWAMDTVSAIHFPQVGNPYAGEVDVVVDGEEFNVVYEQSGAWINGTFYTWEELEAMEDDVDDDFEMDCF